MTNEEIGDIIKQKVLDRVPFSFGITVSNSWLKTVTVHQYTDQIADSLAVQINMELPGTVNDWSTYVPETTWDMFKRDYAPQWFIDLFPIQYEKITHTTYNYLYTQRSI